MARSSLARNITSEYPLQHDEDSLRRVQVKIAPVSIEDRAKRLRNQEIIKAGKRQQIKTFVVVVGFVLLLTGIFGFLLGKQTTLVEMNFANAKLEQQIAKLKIENVQKNSELVASTDLNAIRERALSLGLQDPISTQIVYLNVPVKDRLILGQQYSNLAAATDQTASAARQNIEAFFKSFLP